MQAMACETPALTTKSGAIPEYIEAGVGAYLVNERDSGAIAQAIISYFSMPESEKLKMQKKAREYVMRYDIKEEIAKAEKLFDEILNEK